jgi:DNA-binding CsgD family transcriptional regulator
MTFGVALGTLIYALPAFSGYPALQLAGAVLTGLTSPCLLLLWGERYGGLEIRSVVIYTALSYLLVAVFLPLVFALPASVAAVITAAMPLASLGAWFTLGKEPDTTVSATGVGEASADTGAGAGATSVRTSTDTGTTPADTGADTDNRAIFRELKLFLSPRLLFGFSAVMLIYGGSLAFHGASNSGLLSQTLLYALPPLLLSLGVLGAGLFSSRQALNLSVAYRLILLLIAAIFIPLALLGDSLTFLSAFFASVGVNAIEIVTWILLAYMASLVSVPRFTVFAACNVVFHIGMAAGELSGILLVEHILFFSLFSICMLVALAGFAFTDRDGMIHSNPPSPAELGTIATKSGIIQRSVEGIAADFNLSEREKEVLMLWSVGYGAKGIEKKLFISSSTVKTHIQHIYEKCGVHSRTEIISLLEKRLSDMP